MKKVDAVIALVSVCGVLFLLVEGFYEWAYTRGYQKARVTCPDVQQGEKLRFVEQPFDERLAICVYGKAYAAVSVKRAAK